jgi:hypothetical protein
MLKCTYPINLHFSKCGISTRASASSDAHDFFIARFEYQYVYDLTITQSRMVDTYINQRKRNII